MLVGVGVGVAVGELLVLFLGTGTAQVVLAAAVAMLAVAALIDAPLPLIQAGASAVIVVALQSPETGGGRILDALVGAGVALLMSQILFVPSPVSLLKDEAGDALASISAGLDACADALLNGDGDAAEGALGRLRGGGSEGGTLSDLVAARDAAQKVSRRTLRGRLEGARFARLDARLAGVDLLASSAVLIACATRRLLDGRNAAPASLVRATRDLARAVAALSEDPESADARRSAREPALEAMRLAASRTDGGPDHRAALLLAEGVRLAASDVLQAAARDEGTEAATPETAASTEGGRG